MRVFNETTRRMCATVRTVRAIIAIYDDVIEFGYVANDDANLAYCMCLRNNGETDFDTVLIHVNKNTIDKIIFSTKDGYYFIKSQLQEGDILERTSTMGRGNWIYTFGRYYEAFNNFNYYSGKQVIEHLREFKLSDYLGYSFGVEFETSMGYMPQNIAVKDGLIPLRDGSISGFEYSTVVLEGNNGINLLKQQIEHLKANTSFNKECSLHIHMGGYPIDATAIFIFYSIATILESELCEFVPAYTFNTAKYKSSGKDYCKFLDRYSSFNNLYKGIAEQEYQNDLYLPHPHDVERNHKWDCHARYRWVNVLNMLCYDKAKTIEFRFLRPTYNFYKIYLWLYIFNGILKYSEIQFGLLKKFDDLAIIRNLKRADIKLNSIMHTVYPTHVANCICKGIELLRCAVVNQTNNGDLIGKDTYFEDTINEETLRDLL